ncbi:MAG: glucuronate isomerase [Actinomycetota bacterium]
MKITDIRATTVTVPLKAPLRHAAVRIGADLFALKEKAIMKTNGTGKNNNENARLTERAELHRQVEDVVTTTPVIDIHTHLFSTEFGEMNLSGIDELLTYHYLVAETFRSTEISPEVFWQLNKTQQADLVWQTLFVDNSPLSEATRGVITILSAFGLDPNAQDLWEIREFFQTRDVSSHFDDVLEKACVSDVVMTNDPFDPQEIEVWRKDKTVDIRFHAALRMDRLLNNWKNTAEKLAGFGYRADVNMGGKTVREVRRFLDEWVEIMNPLYMAVSLPDDFEFPTGDVRNRIINEVVLPTAREHDLPFALMIGVRRNVNPALRAAGDGLGRADVGAVERICVENPDVRFLATFLSRENQHELCVSARKFSNLMPFGCWWFLNNPSIVSEITRERLELLGTSFIPQHSDARVLEQLIYKWLHSRRVIADVLFDSYEQLLSSGRAVTRREIERDVARMFSGNFREWVGLPLLEKDAMKDYRFEDVDAAQIF